MRAIPIFPSDTQVPQEHVALCRAYGAVQERCSRVMAQQQRDIDRLESEVVRLRAAVVVRDTALALERQVRAERVQARAGQAANPAAARVWVWPWAGFWPRRDSDPPPPALAWRGANHGRGRLASADVMACQGGLFGAGLDWPG